MQICCNPAMEGSSPRDVLRLIGLLLLGQLLSFFITVVGFTSSALATEGINAPTSLSFPLYVLLAIVYGCIFLGKKGKMKGTWYHFLLLAFVDVEGNYAVIKAYQYTSLTSVMLLDCWTVPCALFLTWKFLKTKYHVSQLVGVCVCIVGLAIVMVSDVHSKDRTAGSHPILGDTLVIIGAMLYATSNVGEEFLLTKLDFVETMTFFGSFGALISACQLLILEFHELEAIHWTTSGVLEILAYNVALFLFYTFVPSLLKMSGSALLNLSLLTSDMWTVLIRIFVYNQVVDWLYFIAFATVAFGLVIYSKWADNSKSSTLDPLVDASKRNNAFTHVDDSYCEGEEQEVLLAISEAVDGEYHLIS